jgi:hypothetical protein
VQPCQRPYGADAGVEKDFLPVASKKPGTAFGPEQFAPVTALP